jgi:hypothetical protein
MGSNTKEQAEKLLQGYLPGSEEAYRVLCQISTWCPEIYDSLMTTQPTENHLSPCKGGGVCDQHHCGLIKCWNEKVTQNAEETSEPS